MRWGVGTVRALAVARATAATRPRQRCALRLPHLTLPSNPADRSAVGPGGFDRKAIERVAPQWGGEGKIKIMTDSR